MFSILIPTYNEEENIKELIPKLKKVASSLNDKFEIIVADAGSKDKTVDIVKKNNVRVFIRKSPEFGSAITEGIPKTKGDYIFTMDGDFSHNPKYLKEMWKYRKDYDIIIASRWVDGGSSEQSLFRKWLSKFFNYFYKIGLSLNFYDMNSNFRLYKRSIFNELKLDGKGTDILPEILYKAKIKGYSILEIPFHYSPRKKGRSKLKLLNFGIIYFKRFLELWKLKNSIDETNK
jgi:dolichol-phosphate mannosyltransferase